MKYHIFFFSQIFAFENNTLLVLNSYEKVKPPIFLNLKTGSKNVEFEIEPGSGAYLSCATGQFDIL